MADFQQCEMGNNNLWKAKTKNNCKKNKSKKSLAVVRRQLHNGEDPFQYLPNELILKIFEYLPVLSLLNCELVCKRFLYCGRDVTLWRQVKLCDNTLHAGAMDFISKRPIQHIKLHRMSISEPVFSENFLRVQPYYQAEYVTALDLRGIIAPKQTIAALLSHFHILEELTVQLVTFNADICKEIGKCVQLKRLRIFDCPGIRSWKMLLKLKQLTDLYISSPFFTVKNISVLVVHIPGSVLRLKLEGCRDHLIDEHLKLLMRCCPEMREMILGNCYSITAKALRYVRKSNKLNTVAFDKCQAIGHFVIMDFIRTNGTKKFRFSGALSESAQAFLQEHSDQFIMVDD